MKSSIILFFSLLYFPTGIFSQISSFPHTENFESGAGGWTTGGTNSSWVRGTPAKPVISACGQGTFCWVTNLAANYPINELSWVMSPVYNLSSLSHPMVSFQIVWETEQSWDGAGFQYSTDGGATWRDMPFSAPANCLKANWYNQASVVYLDMPTNNRGWSGNITNIIGGGCVNGAGSNGWRTSSHCLTGLTPAPANLGGQTNVRFRFIFGSGSTCQDDGVAFDNFTVQESPNQPFFTFSCGGIIRELDFQGENMAASCGSPYSGWSWNWDFGDPASGVDNTSTAWTPAHQFSSNGNYLVTLTATNPCGLNAVSTQLIIVNDFTCVLPFVLIDFQAEVNENAIDLNWQTKDEEEIRKFIVERSLDQHTFEYVGTVPATGSNGNSENYSLTDIHIPSGEIKIYYKLTAVNENGHRWTAGSDWVTLAPPDEFSIVVYPDPVEQGSLISLDINCTEEGLAQVSIGEMNGAILIETEKFLSGGYNRLEMETTGLASGLYFLRVLQNGSMKAMKFMVR